MWNEFKEFAVKGNAMDMAVGIIIGAAFGAIVTALVEGIVMPPVGLLVGGVDFSNDNARYRGWRERHVNPKVYPFLRLGDRCGSIVTAAVHRAREGGVVPTWT